MNRFIALKDVFIEPAAVIGVALTVAWGATFEGTDHKQNIPTADECAAELIPNHTTVVKGETGGYSVTGTSIPQSAIQKCLSDATKIAEQKNAHRDFVDTLALKASGALGIVGAGMIALRRRRRLNAPTAKPV